MSEPDDPLGEFLRVLKGGEGNERLKALAHAFEAAERRREKEPESAEAREWLLRNRHRHPLAMNHFATRGDAERFVEDLYRAGATRVMVDNIAYHEVDNWGGAHSNSLNVDLPTDPESRARIISLCNAHCMADASSGAPFIDDGQSTLRLWWD